MNSITIIGNLATDPARKEVNDSVVCSFRVASGKSNNRNGRVFIDVDTWGKLAATCHTHLSKGRQVAINGSLAQREYIPHQGDKKTVTYIRADDVQFLGPAT